jgi:hypothetical protein
MTQIPFRNHGRPIPPKKTEVAKEPTVQELLQGVATQLKTLGENLAATNQRIDTLAKPPAQQQQPRQQQEEQSNQFVSPTDDEYAANPTQSIMRVVDHAMSQRMREEAGPVVAAAFDANTQLHREALKKKHGGVYNLLEADLDTFIKEKGIGADILATRLPDGSTGIERAFQTVVGMNLPKIMDSLRKFNDEKPVPREREEVPFVERGGPRQAPQLGADERMSDAELEVAKTLGISSEEYLAGRKASIVTTPDLGGRNGRT